ncbi:tubulin epsilon and delta complex protein 1-like isoform X2 [Choloepus didactylus]|uniref:tubulin epsilon and delta complex protein 1-like isoform X2 n=1 Tax=Choloepus didactylus TaxID=27675 RepID=UPI0018A08A84|nr:tubulin epsilon and delta complex protein 1-like isoform X2 [Choloepus didactylus]
MGRQRRRVDRAAGAGSGTLPEAIAALSRALPCGPSPETFRRAKFDRPEAAPALWQLLFRVLSPVSEAGATAPPAPEAQARLVKAALRSEGYPRPALAQLPEDGSRGSRELLLALSWLLARRPLLERLLARTRVRLGDEVAVCECLGVSTGCLGTEPDPCPLQCEDLAFGRANTGLPALGLGSELHVDIRHVQWLMGKLRFQWRNLVSTQQEQCALLSKAGSLGGWDMGSLLLSPAASRPAWVHTVSDPLVHMGLPQRPEPWPPVCHRDGGAQGPRGQPAAAAGARAGKRTPSSHCGVAAPGAGLLAVDGPRPEPGSCVELCTAGLAGDRGTGAGGPAVGLGPRQGPGPAPWALPAGEE